MEGERIIARSIPKGITGSRRKVIEY